MKTSDLPYVELLYDALRARNGLIVRSSRAKALRERLLVVRKGYPDLAAVAVVPADTDILWLIKKELVDARRSEVSETHS